MRFITRLIQRFLNWTQRRQHGRSLRRPMADYQELREQAWSSEILEGDRAAYRERRLRELLERDGIDDHNRKRPGAPEE